MVEPTNYEIDYSDKWFTETYPPYKIGLRYNCVINSIDNSILYISIGEKRLKS